MPLLVRVGCGSVSIARRLTPQIMSQTIYPEPPGSQSLLLWLSFLQIKAWCVAFWDARKDLIANKISNKTNAAKFFARNIRGIREIRLIRDKTGEPRVPLKVFPAKVFKVFSKSKADSCITYRKTPLPHIVPALRERTPRSQRKL